MLRPKCAHRRLPWQRITSTQAGSENPAYLNFGNTISLATAMTSLESAHMLVAYQDFSGSVRIADLNLFNPSGTAKADFVTLDEFVTDIVVLNNVSLTGLAANTSATAGIHLVT
jgi:hypothetical protein